MPPVASTWRCTEENYEGKGHRESLKSADLEAEEFFPIVSTAVTSIIATAWDPTRLCEERERGGEERGKGGKERRDREERGGERGRGEREGREKERENERKKGGFG